MSYIDVWTPMQFDLIRTYTDKKRHYHGINHIEECMLELNKLIKDGLVKDPEALRLAIWFHDYVLSHNGEDELRSAWKGYDAAMALGHPAHFADTVQNLILVTTHDTVKYPPKTKDEYFMCDIDLAPLAAPNFFERSVWVRLEYPEVPGLQFEPERKKILKKFLERQYIYYTPVFRNQYEAKARENLKNVYDPTP